MLKGKYTTVKGVEKTYIYSYSILTANGFKMSQAKKICINIFSSFFCKLIVDEEKRIFTILVYRNIPDPSDKSKTLNIDDFIDMAHFEAIWCKKGGNRWQVKYVED